MSTFVMPSLGADMESAVLMEWHVKEGDHVKKGDIIAEVETSKGVIEIEVFEEGIIEKLLVTEETECAVGSPLALIRSDETAPPTDATAPSLPAEPAPVLEPQPAYVPAETAPAEIPAVVTPTESPHAEEAAHEHLHASPAARRRAKEMGIDLFTLAAQGETLHLAQVEAAAPPTPEPTPAPEPSSPVSGMRQAIARAMSRSNAEIPHYYLSTAINMTPALKWLEEENTKRPIRERILPAALLIRAVVKALEAVPELNGFWRDDAPQPSDHINPGIAIAKRKEGLITPALIDAQTMSLDQTMKALDDLITRTRSGKLRSSELTQQSITITNLGDLGVESVYGVIYPPQVAIVGLGRIIDAPWAEGDALCVRKVMQATLAGDHRATDGRTGALFLDTFNRYLQNTHELL